MLILTIPVDAPFLLVVRDCASSPAFTWGVRERPPEKSAIRCMYCETKCTLSRDHGVDGDGFVGWREVGVSFSPRVGEPNKSQMSNCVLEGTKTTGAWTTKRLVIYWSLGCLEKKKKQCFRKSLERGNQDALSTRLAGPLEKVYYWLWQSLHIHTSTNQQVLRSGVGRTAWKKFIHDFGIITCWIIIIGINGDKLKEEDFRRFVLFILQRKRKRWLKRRELARVKDSRKSSWNEGFYVLVQKRFWQ